MRKIKLFGVTACMLVFGMLSLGSGSASTDTTKAITSGPASEAGEKEGSTSVDADSVDGKEDGKKDSISSSSSASITLEEQVLIDEDGLKITALSYEEDSIWGDGIKLLLENNGDSDLMVGIDAVIVNDYMVSNLFSETIAAGKKVNETLDLLSSQLKDAGIENVGQVEIYFHVTDPDTFQRIKEFDCVTVKTSAYDNMDRVANDAGQELYNDNGVRIVGKYVNENTIWGTGVILYIENNSDRKLTVQCEDMSINGFMVQPYFSCDVYAGKKAIDDISVLSSDLKDNGIESVDEIELKFRIIDEDWSTIAESDAITFSAK